MEVKPLSRNKRRTFLVFFFLVFIISAPLFILDAKGYRLDLKEVLKLSQTGGLYISTDQSGIEIYLNGELVRKTSIIQKSVFVQDLKPGTYDIRVSKEGLQTWSKNLKVFPEIVTEARSFLIKTKPKLTEVPRTITSTTTATRATSSRVVSSKNPEYESLSALFAPPVQSTPVVKPSATSSENKAARKLVFKKEDDKLLAKWEGESDAIPNYFCESATCKSEIVISANSPILSFETFPGRDDLLILRLAGGIYISEIDDRSPQNIQKIVEGAGYDFRIKDGKEIYLKKDAKIYSVSL